MKKSSRISVLIVLMMLSFVQSYAQNKEAPTGSLKPRTDSLMSPKKQLWEPNPKKAGLYAALLPGLGQMYNRQYWKLPIVYGGLTVAGYFIVRNTKDYNDLRGAYISRIGKSEPYTDKYADIYDDTALEQLQNDANRLLNLTIVFSTLAYVTQVLDAITSAHLRNFDISRDISLHVQPVVVPQGAGVALVMQF